MRYHEIVRENARRMMINDHEIVVLINPSAAALVSFFKRTHATSGLRYDYPIKGIVCGDKIYWWDAYYAHHMQVGELLDPDFNVLDRHKLLFIARSLEGNPKLVIDFEAILQHPQIRRILSTGEITVE